MPKKKTSKKKEKDKDKKVKTIPVSTDNNREEELFIYFPLKSKDSSINKLTVKAERKGKIYKYQMLHTSLDALIRYLQLNNLSFDYYTIFPAKAITIVNRYNLEGQVSAKLPFTVHINKVYPLKYKRLNLSFNHGNTKYRTIDTSYIWH